MKSIRCLLKKKKSAPLERRHPWVFSGAIDRIDEGYEAGDLVRVYSAEDRFLGIGYMNPQSQITLRMLAFEDVPIDRGFFSKRLQEAYLFRKTLFDEQTTAYRLVHSEGDFLPGLIVDRYENYLVVQVLTAGMERFKDTVLDSLQELFPAEGIYEKGDSEWRRLEGLPDSTGVVRGKAPPAEITVKENGLNFAVSIPSGQKTGFYLDQRENRERILSLSKGREVLNAFSYTGSFSVYALKGGAKSVMSVDSSKPALELAKKNFQLNSFPVDEKKFASGDVFDFLTESKDSYDLIVLDPPAFCKHKQQIEKACRGYKDVNLRALRRLRPGGLLFTFSCSSYMTPDLFQKVVFAAAKDSGRDVRILTKTSHPLDHPFNICHPEGEYLKGILCEVR